jgi:hypothetical protein
MHRTALLILALTVGVLGGCADQAYEVDPDSFSPGGDGVVQADGSAPQTDGGAITADVATGNDTGGLNPDKGSQPTPDYGSAGPDACVNPTSCGVDLRLSQGLRDRRRAARGLRQLGRGQADDAQRQRPGR